MKPTLRPARYDDITEMYSISSRVHLTPLYDQLIPQSGRKRFDERYQPSKQRERSFTKRLTRWLEDPDVMMAAVAVVSGRIAGYTIAKHQDGVLLLSGLFVDPDFQSQGIGSQLFTESLSWRHDGEVIQLVVLAENTRAQQLYMRHGFHVTRPADQLFFDAPQDVMERRTSELS